jgi:hypothetical protein
MYLFGYYDFFQFGAPGTEHREFQVLAEATCQNSCEVHSSSYINPVKWGWVKTNYYHMTGEITIHQPAMT